jgi:hypothetical protein
MIAMAIIYVVAELVLVKVYGNIETAMLKWAIFVGFSLSLFIVTIFVLNKVTKGQAELKSGYKATVGVSMFTGSRTRWEGYFKTKFGALFSALYRAWYLDHFGNVHSEFGVVYGVRSIK